MDRLRGCGNAVVPQQVYPIFEAIVAHETQRSSAGRGGAVIHDCVLCLHLPLNY